MSRDTVQLNVRVDSDVVEQFRAYTREHRGQIRGEMGQLVENALVEYMDNDRTARVEDVVRENNDLLNELADTLSEAGGHTHTPSDSVSGGSETVEKTHEIKERLDANHGTGLTEAELNRAITDIAGGHPQTKQKYRNELKQRGLAFEHPNDHSDVWFLDREPWFAQVKAYASSTPSPEKTIDDILTDYDVQTRKVDGRLELVSADDGVVGDA